VRFRRSGYLLAVAMLVGLMGCTERESRLAARGEVAPSSTGTVDPAPAADAEPLPDPAPIRWEPCGALECGAVRVPLDYDDLAGRQIDIAVARRPAPDGGRRLGSLLVNPGGPGGSGIDFLASSGLLGLTDRFDLVSWDPRGVGRSEPLACGSDQVGFLGLDPDPDDPAEQEALEREAARIATACAQEDPALLANIDTTIQANDLEMIRRALGQDQINYLGFSYGTLIGLEYARRFPTRLRTLVLDGVVDPQLTLEQMLTGQAVQMERYLADLADLYDRVMARAEHEPLVLRDGSPAGPDVVVLAAIAATYRGGGREELRRALTAADRGDPTLLGELASAYVTASDSFGAYVAVLCADGPRPAGIEGWRAMALRLAEQAPHIGAPAVNEVLACAFWPVEPTRRPAPVAPEGLAPALVIGTTGDAATPYDDAVRVTHNLPGAVLLTFDADGHTATGRSRCVQRVVRRYLEDLELPEPGSACG
jgi:pimeloyl-ACP methyl ester carboxylesterase